MDEKEIKKLLGLRIKQLRKCLNLTQFELGEKIGIDQRQVAYIEGGNSFPSLKTLIKFSTIFDCPIKELFNYEHLQTAQNMKSEIVKKISKLNEKKQNILYQLINIIENNY